MEELLNIPVKLVVKAPNQKIADQTVECALNWTVRKLKEHLASVYPNKPLENQQRIIYSGRLLLDHEPLKDVLKQYEPNQTIHTVHLVCMTTTEAFYQSTAAPSATANMPACGSASSTAGASVGTEGLRHRHPPAADTPGGAQSAPAGASAAPLQVPPEQSSQAASTATTLPYAYGSYYQPQQHYAAYMQPRPAQQPSTATPGAINQTMFGAMPVGTMPVGMMPGMAGAYGMDAAAQMMWMQQAAYAQYMTQYMHYYQQASQATNPLAAMPPTPLAPPANQNAPAVAPANEARPAAAAANQRQPQAVRMNAQGGAVVDDDDDEDEPHRDWLDLVYTFIRFAMLLCILYFYSSLSRFITTLTLVILAHLYHRGYFRLNRRGGREEQPAARGQQPAPQPQDQANPAGPGVVPPPGVNDDRVDNAELNAGNEAAAAAAATGAAATEAPVPRPPGTLALAWNFFVAFFVSLAPQQPPVVNAN